MTVCERDGARVASVYFGREGSAAWMVVTPGGPPPRNVHGMAFDRAREVIVLYGGIHSPITYDDTWEWDGGGWTQGGIGPAVGPR